MKNYFKVLLQGCLKVEKGDKLFISLSYKDKTLIEELLEVSYGIGISDLSIDYYENNDSRAWGRYIEDEAKFLFLIGDNFDNTLASNILSGFRNGEINIDYLAAPTFEILSKYDSNHEYVREENPLIGFSKANSKYNKSITNFKNYKFNELFIRSLSDINLRLDFDNDFIYRRTGVINMFPYYGIDIRPYRDSVTGYLDTISPTIIDGEVIEGLRLSIDKSMIVDFDSDNNHDLIKELFKRANGCKVESISLVGSDSPLYSYLGTYNHQVLDMNANSYVTLITKDQKKIYVPIETKNLEVIGVTNSGSKAKVYAKEKFLISQ